MKKRFTALLLSTAMVITLTAGCNSSGSNDTGQGEAVKQETKDETQKEENKGTGDQVIELSFPNIWVGNDSKAEVFGKMVDGFNTEYICFLSGFYTALCGSMAHIFFVQPVKISHICKSAAKGNGGYILICM